MTRTRLGIVLLALCGAAATAHCSWATPAADVASNVPYDDGWLGGDDGGTGFAAWTQFNSGTSGFFMGNSLNLDGPGFGADINTSSRSFGMYAGPGAAAAEASRSFDSNLSLGEAFSLELAVNFRNGNKGVDIRDSSFTTIFNFNVGGDDYVVSNTASGNGSIGSSYSANTEFKLTLTQTSVSSGTWSISRSGGVTDLDSGTYTGVPASFKLYVNNTDGGSPNDLYSNSFLITAVPEASAVWLGLLTSVAGSIAWCGRRLRARNSSRLAA